MSVLKNTQMKPAYAG